MKKLHKIQKKYTYCMVIGLSHSLGLFTLASLIFRPSTVRPNTRKVVVLCRRLHFFSLQYNLYLCKSANTFSTSPKCSFAIVLYISLSSRKITTPLSSISTNKLFFIHMNVSDISMSPIGIMIHSYSPYWVKNAVFGTSFSAIQHYQ